MFLSKNGEDAELEEEEDEQDYDDRNEINPDDDVINDFWMVMVKNKTTVDNSFENSFYNSFDIVLIMILIMVLIMILILEDRAICKQLGPVGRQLRK